MTKLCECGCGGQVALAKETTRSRGWTKGKPRRFVNGHNKGNLRHGKTHTPEHTAYRRAKGRCTNPRHHDWVDYGGRGIKFLFTDFKQFIADIGPRPSPQHSLDRIHNTGNYAPGNVRWATPKEQAANRRPKQKGQL